MVITVKGIRYLILVSFAACALCLPSCQKIDLFEKNVAIPRQEWKSDFKPRFQFEITDTTALYNIFIVLRHNEKYEFNNIWLSLTTKIPGDTIQTGQYELPLANNDGWLGTAMDDLYEHRILITPVPQKFVRPGQYTFTIGQVMRKDPLENVLNIGLRIEKKP
jgi:gliding motility-associated lipoprotein GldH